MLRYFALHYHVHSFRLCYDVHAQENRIHAWSHPCDQVASIQSSYVHTARLRPCLNISIRSECIHTIQSYPYDRSASMPDHIHTIHAYPYERVTSVPDHIHTTRTRSMQATSIQPGTSLKGRIHTTGLHPCRSHPYDPAHP